MSYAILALLLTVTLGSSAVVAPAWAADTINVYTAWPESLSQPIFKVYTAKAGTSARTEQERLVTRHGRTGSR